MSRARMFFWVWVFALTLVNCKSERGVVEPSPVEKPKAILSVNPLSAVLIVGESFTLSPRCLRSTRMERSWAPASPLLGDGLADIVTVDTFWPDSSGSEVYSLVCIGKGGVENSRITVTIRPIPPLSGRVFLFQDRPASFGNASFFVRKSGITHFSAIDPLTGLFSVETPLLKNSYVEEGIEPVGEGEGLFGSLDIVGRADYSSPQTFLLHLKDWTVKTGKYAGFSSTVDIIGAFEFSGDGRYSFWGKSQRENGGWGFNRPAIPEGKTLLVGIRDSTINLVVVRQAIDSVNQILGVEYFRLVDYSSLPADPTQSVQIYIGNVVYGDAVAGPWFDLSGTSITGGVVVLRDPPTTRLFVFVHELLHVMGFGHTCSWPSVMWTSCDVGIDKYMITASDALHIEYDYTAQRAVQRTNTKYGVWAAYNWERRQRGMEPEWSWQAVDIMSGGSGQVTTRLTGGPTLHLFYEAK